MWKVSRNGLPNQEVKEFETFEEAMKEAKKLSNEVIEVVIENDRETFVLRKLWD